LTSKGNSSKYYVLAFVWFIGFGVFIEKVFCLSLVANSSGFEMLKKCQIKESSVYHRAGETKNCLWRLIICEHSFKALDKHS
jgi:hypothetical protein